MAEVTKYDIAGDLASFHGVDPHVALEAVNAVLSGDVAPIRRFGINVPTPDLAELAQQTKALCGTFPHHGATRP